MGRHAVTVFSWGYWGWGNATQQFVRAVDAVERQRGFRPPLFVDIRLRRSGRAPGFQGTAFENLVGPKRHRWMNGLGNKQIATRSGPPIQIAEPAAANDLLDLALECADEGRRVIFFCGCGYPKRGGKIACHRAKVATVLLKAAKRRKVTLEVVEWPGGNPDKIELRGDERAYQAVTRAGSPLSPGRQLTVSKMAGLPAGSVVGLTTPAGSIVAVVEAAVFQRGEWRLPVWDWRPGDGISRRDVMRIARSYRRSFGLEPRESL